MHHYLITPKGAGKIRWWNDPLQPYHHYRALSAPVLDSQTPAENFFAIIFEKEFPSQSGSQTKKFQNNGEPVKIFPSVPGSQTPRYSSDFTPCLSNFYDVKPRPPFTGS